MAKYRQIYTDFWNDGFVLDLTPEEKYFYIYLLTNANTTQCGAYELPKRIIETQTGYNRETVDKLLIRFQDYGKIVYSNETREIIIFNWIKYNIPKSVNAIKCITKEISVLKNEEFKNLLYENFKSYKVVIQRPLKKESKINDSESNDFYEENNKESYKKRKGKSNNDELEITFDEYEEEAINKSIEHIEGILNIDNVIQLYNENINKVTPLEKEKIYSFVKEFNCEIVIKAIYQAVIYNGKNISYIEKILNNWSKNNIRTAEEVEKYIKKWRKSTKQQSEEDICQYAGGYDYDKLEKGLLGIDNIDGFYREEA